MTQWNKVLLIDDQSTDLKLTKCQVDKLTREVIHIKMSAELFPILTNDIYNITVQYK